MIGKRLFLLVLAAAFCFGLFSTANAQSRDDQWNRLASLRPGAKLVIERDGGRTVKAKFVSLADQTLIVKDDGRPTEISRDQISAIYMGKNSSRLKRGFIGALAGAGAGVLIGSIVTVSTKGNGLAAAAGFLYGLPVGAAIGAASGGGMKRGALIYSR